MRGFVTIKNCIPYSKNPKIAKIFREIGLADELGSGVRNITNYSEIYSGSEPIFEEGEIFKATVPLVKVEDKALDKAPDKMKEIVLYCNEPRTAIQIMEHFEYKNIKRFRRDYIKPLVEEGILKMTIPDMPTSKNQKYISK